MTRMDKRLGSFVSIGVLHLVAVTVDKILFLQLPKLVSVLLSNYVSHCHANDDAVFFQPHAPHLHMFISQHALACVGSDTHTLAFSQHGQANIRTHMIHPFLTHTHTRHFTGTAQRGCAKHFQPINVAWHFNTAHVSLPLKKRRM